MTSEEDATEARDGRNARFDKEHSNGEEHRVLALKKATLNPSADKPLCDDYSCGHLELVADALHDLLINSIRPVKPYRVASKSMLAKGRSRTRQEVSRDRPFIEATSRSRPGSISVCAPPTKRSLCYNRNMVHGCIQSGEYNSVDSSQPHAVGFAPRGTSLYPYVSYTLTLIAA